MGRSALIRVAGRTTLAVMLAGCAILPTTPLPAWQGDCGLGVGRDLILHGSAADGRVAWAIDGSGAGRVDLLWPRGYMARFNPELEIIDANGRLVAHDGDLITGSCLTAPGDGGAIRIGPGDVRPPDWKPGDG
jgi:hypothetical protein